MKAGIIAAGEGSRLKAEGIDIPKPLVPIDGVPLIERLIRSFIRNGITEVACIVNEYSLEVKRFVEERNFTIPVRFVVRTTPSSMHSLFALAPHLSDGRFLLSTVDPIYVEEEFSAFLRHGAIQSNADGLLAITQYIDDEHPLYVRLDAENRIQAFSKTESSPWVTGGLYMFSPRIFDEMTPALDAGIERLRAFLAHLVQRAYVLEGFPFSKIIDVDHATDLEAARRWLEEDHEHHHEV